MQMFLDGKITFITVLEHSVYLFIYLSSLLSFWSLQMHLQCYMQVFAFFVFAIADVDFSMGYRQYAMYGVNKRNCFIILPNVKSFSVNILMIIIIYYYLFPVFFTPLQKRDSKKVV